MLEVVNHVDKVGATSTLGASSRGRWDPWQLRASLTETPLDRRVGAAVVAAGLQVEPPARGVGSRDPAPALETPRITVNTAGPQALCQPHCRA